jgi:hypothetical protein
MTLTVSQNWRTWAGSQLEWIKLICLFQADTVMTLFPAKRLEAGSEIRIWCEKETG